MIHFKKNITRKIFKNKTLNKLYLSFLFFVITVFLFVYLKNSNDIKIIKKKFQNEINKKENLADNVILKIYEQFKYNNNWESINEIIPNEFYNKNGIGIFIYKNDKCFYWSDIAIPVSNIEYSKNIIKLKNGYYRLISKEYGEYRFYAYILIKNKYPYENEFLKNSFFKNYNIPDEVVIENEKTSNSIYSKNGDFLFSIKLNTEVSINENYIYISLTFILISFIYFSLFLYEVYCKINFFNKNQLLKNLFFIFNIIFIRVIQFNYNFPDFLYKSRVFSPYYFATSFYLPSLGDLIINSILILLISYIFFVKTDLSIIKKSGNKYINYIIVLFFNLITILLFYSYIIVNKSVIIDSNVQILFEDFFKLKIETILVIFIFFTLSFSIVLIIYKICLINKIYIDNFKKLIYNSIFSFLLFIIFLKFNINKEFIIYFIFYFLLIDYILLINFKFKINFIKNIALLLFIFSLLISYTILKYSDIKELDKNKLLIQKISAEKDPILEYLFKDIIVNIKSDSVIHNYIKLLYPEEKIKKIINDKYLNGYIEKYNCQITLCKDFQNLIVKPNNFKINCDKYFYDKITNNGFPTQTENFYSMDYGNANKSYIAVLRLLDDKNDTLLRTSLYIELEAKSISKDLGYPELLVDKKLNLVSDLSDFSYAKYVDNNLVKRYGKYLYSNTLNNYYNNKEFFVYEKEGYKHIYYNYNNHIKFILSKKQSGFLNKLSFFSNIFILLFFFTIITCFLSNNFKYISPSVYSYKAKLQISILMIIIISFLIIGIVTYIYITELNNSKNSELLTEKTHSILIELEHKLGDIQYFSDDLSFRVNELLVNLSNVFFTDVNLYDTNGKLIASSRKQIFDEGLISDKMNSKAFYMLKILGKSQFIDKENIGESDYLSSYIPFINNDNKIIAFLNLPYFAKQSDLKKEVSLFLKTYLNIYLFLIIVALIIALFISNYITRPLKLIIENLSKIKLGKKNEKISWKSNDEIGTLISEYNSLIDQLAESAEKLAKSEREYAWREMAKQIAHEIKNPLTPMKLNIQHLQRTWNDKAPDLELKVKRLTNNIIEQIDILSTIANEFYNFAQMPKSDFTRIDISKILNNTVDFFKVSIPFNITITDNIKSDCFVFADKNQLISVFNNLIKNAIQSIGNNIGIISNFLKEESETYLIEIHDNGSGIEDNLKDRIFSPYFTTKTSGTGLGLALVKSIVDGIGGKIWFNSELKEGTTFFIQFNKIG